MMTGSAYKIIPLFFILLTTTAAPAFAAMLPRETADQADFISQHEQMLANQNFAQLDQDMNQVQENYGTGKINDIELKNRFRTYRTVPWLEERYSAWISAYPRSYAAREGRAIYYKNVLYKNLGDRKITALPADEKEKLKHYADMSLSDLQAAIKLSDKPLLSYDTMLDLTPFTAVALTNRQMVDIGDKFDPQNLIVKFKYITSLEDGPNASISDMEAYVEGTRKIGLKDNSYFLLMEHLNDEKGNAAIEQKPKTLSLLQSGNYTALDKEMNDAQQAYEKGKLSDVDLFRWFQPFYSTDPKLEKNLDEWVSAFPNSYSAREARANYYHELAAAARGSGYIVETSHKEISGMQHYAHLSWDEAHTATSLTAKPILSISLLMSLARMAGADSLIKQMYNEAEKIDPSNEVVRYEYMFGLQQRWGGSLEQMESFRAALEKTDMPKWLLPEFDKLIFREKRWIDDQDVYNHGNIGLEEIGN